MNNYEAAIVIIGMVAELRVAGYYDADYREAAALACRELLMRDCEEGGKPNEPKTGEAPSPERAH